jgi:hypothetical protein
MVLNTSYNVKGQPIVNTPEQALETFLNCGIDYLFLEDSLVRRKRGRSHEDQGAYSQAPDQVQLERLRHV